MSESTAVATVREQGRHALAQTRTLKEVVTQVKGAEWASGNTVIKGEGFSPVAVQAMAVFCHTIGAHPQLHVDLLGGKPYLNAAFYADLVNSEERFVDYAQIDITDDIERRKHYRAPEDAAVVYETVIRKLVPFAPLEKIRAGEITDWQNYAVEVREANWAGHKRGRPDPVGAAETAKTARTRSFRRCAAKAFPAWKSHFEEKLERAEQIVEAEFTIVEGDRQQERASLPAPDGPQAVASGGEPTAANARAARPLPVEGEIEQEEDAAPAGGGNQGHPGGSPEAAPAPAVPFDKEDARKRLFAQLRDAGIKDANRKKWAKENGLPESTQSWGPAEYEKAFAALKPALDEALEALRSAVMELLGGDIEELEDLSLRVLQKSVPEYVNDWRKLMQEAEKSKAADSDL